MRIATRTTGIRVRAREGPDTDVPHAEFDWSAKEIYSEAYQ